MMFGWSDLTVLGLYFVAVLAVGFWFGRGERSTHEYFLGGRRQHWLVVGLSIIATEVSALTFLLVPGRSFQSDCWYLQLYAGAFIGRMFIVFFFLPAFYGGSVTTVYEYLGQRFGPWTRTLASLMFFASRIVGSGIRLLAASLAITLIFHWPLIWVVLIGAAVAIAYTTFGGIKAIIWTDALQAVVFLGGGVAVVVFLFMSTPGSWLENLFTVYHAGKFHTFTWDWNPNNDRVFWVLLIHATVQNMAALGVDQDLTQRMLTCPDLARGQRSLIFNTFMGLPVVCLFLLIGVLMYTYYQSGVAGAFPAGTMGSGDRVFPYFISTVVPAGYGLKGLLVAAIFAAAMSSLDSALGALSSSAVTDFYRPFVVRRRAGRTPETSLGARPAGRNGDVSDLWVARFFSVVFGVLLAVVALGFAGSETLLEDAFGWVGLIFGGMLGVFLLGVTTRTRGNDRFNTIAMLSSIAVLVVVKYKQDRYGLVSITWPTSLKIGAVAWPWWVVIGTVWTYLLGVCFPTSWRPSRSG